MNEGNQYYKLRKTHGRPTEYTPDKLLDKWNDYVDWVANNPIKVKENIKVKAGRDIEEIKTVDLEKERPFGIKSFCNFAGITFQTFQNYEQRSDFFDLPTRIKQQVEANQTEGGLTRIFDPNMISMFLGLADKTIEIKNAVTSDEIEIKKSSEATSH